MNSDKPCILIVDDEESIRESFSLILQDDYDLISVSTGEAALKKAVDHKIDLVFLDIRMPGMDGMETLQRLKKIDPSIEVIMVTAVNDVQKAGESVKIGANNYIVKPFDVSQIISMAKALTRKKQLRTSASSLREDLDGTRHLPELTGQSKVLQSMTDRAMQLSGSEDPVLILGEPGTEKEAVAYMIHSSSRRKDSGFGIIDLTPGMDEKDIYVRLFGSGKGTSVYDLDKSSGLFERFSQGTLLINNIEHASEGLVRALAEAAEKKTARRHGSSQDIPADVRLIFSSSEEIYSQDSPQKSLLESIIGDSLLIPPLRSRGEDIPEICQELIERHARSAGRKVREISADAMEILRAYPWPGNYDEINNTLKKAVTATASEAITCLDLPFCVLLWSPAFSYIDEASGLSLDSLTSVFEKEFILKILKKCNFEMQTASKILNINRNMLLSKIETLEIK